MQKRLIAGLVLTLLALSSMALAAESFKFRLSQDAQISGTELKAGRYVIRLNDEDEAEILQRGKVLLKAKVEVQPLPDKSVRNSVVILSGQVSEIRLKNHLILIKGS